MTDENKAKTLENIESMEPFSSTNMWHGIRDGLGLFSEAEGGSTGRVPALLVLTDGMPNYMCPPKGYVPMLRSMEPLPATIHTFGFGYELRSGLLKSIAEVGGGNYSFIPDAGMLVSPGAQMSRFRKTNKRRVLSLSMLLLISSRPLPTTPSCASHIRVISNSRR